MVVSLEVELFTADGVLVRVEEEALGVDGPASDGCVWAFRAAARCMNLRLSVPVDNTMVTSSRRILVEPLERCSR